MIDVFPGSQGSFIHGGSRARYGFRPNRAGFIPCPFHSEKTASLKLYEDGGWYCFGCHTGGSSIDFTAKLFGLTPLDALRQLDRDFHLCLPLDRQQTAQERTEAQSATRRRRELNNTYTAFEAWRGGMLDKLSSCLRLAHFALRDCQSPDGLSEGEALAVKWQGAAAYWADCLLSGDMAAQMEIFRDRKEVDALCKRILGDLLTRSNVA